MINNQISEEIDISNFPSGFYFVKVFDDKSVRIEKLIIQ